MKEIKASPLFCQTQSLCGVSNTLFASWSDCERLKDVWCKDEKATHRKPAENPRALFVFGISTVETTDDTRRRDSEKI